MTDASVSLEGLKEVWDLIAKLPDQLAREVYPQAARDALEIMRDDARARVPEEAGRLRDAIKIRTEKSGARGGVRAQLYVDPGAQGAGDAHLVEYGTDPHRIPKRGSGGDDGAVNRSGDGQDKRTQYPGAKATPFMRPAFEATKQRVVDTLGINVIKGVERQVRSLSRSSK